MCQFISWVEEDNKPYYLDNKALKTKEGKSLLKYLRDNDSLCDLQGHGALRRYYSELKGRNQECTDFSTPENFPKEIVNSIKNMEMTNILFGDETPLVLLNSEGQAEYQKIKQSALAEYKKIEQSALAEYQKIKQPAWAEYKKIEQPAWAEYKKIKQPAWAEYEKIEQPAWAEYEKIEQPAWAEYKKIKQPAWAEYKKIKQPALWKLFKQEEYRNKLWI